MTRYLWDCIYCGYPTKHPSMTCPAHRDLSPPLYGLDLPYPDALESPDDAGGHPRRDPAGGADLCSDAGETVES